MAILGDTVAKSLKVIDGVTGLPVGGTYVQACTEGKALINATTTSFGAIFNAPTSSCRVSLATYPANGNDVILYSVTNNNISSQSNTVHRQLTWNADTGAFSATSFVGPLTGNASTATKLATARSLKTDLASTTAITFDGSQDRDNIPITGTLGPTNGGTGQTSEINACNAFLNALSTGSSTPVDADYYISQYVNGGTTTKTYHRRPMSCLYTYIKGKTDTVYAAKATTLAGYNIADAKIASGTITLGTDSITPLTADSTLNAAKLSGTIPSSCYTNTTNTAGSTDTSSKIFLVGATSQAANPQTYSDNEVYATNGVLTTKSVQVGGTACTLQYNSTNQCVDFVFA